MLKEIAVTKNLPNTNHQLSPLAPLSKQQVARVIAEAGFPVSVVPTVTCLAEHESRFQPSAVNLNTNHTHDYGLLQINDVWLEECHTTPHQLKNPLLNAKCAFKIFKTQGLSAWTTFKIFKNTCLKYQVESGDYVQIAESKLLSHSSHLLN